MPSLRKKPADKLCCKKLRSIQHHVAMFGGHKTERGVKMVTLVQLTHLQRIEAIKTAEVCAPLVQPKLKADLEGLKLAKISSGLVKI